MEIEKTPRVQDLTDEEKHAHECVLVKFMNELKKKSLTSFQTEILTQMTCKWKSKLLTVSCHQQHWKTEDNGITFANNQAEINQESPA